MGDGKKKKFSICRFLSTHLNSLTFGNLSSELLLLIQVFFKTFQGLQYFFPHMLILSSRLKSFNDCKALELKLGSILSNVRFSYALKRGQA